MAFIVLSWKQSMNSSVNGELYRFEIRQIKVTVNISAYTVRIPTYNIVLTYIIYHQELIICRGEYLTPYSPVLYDCAEVKRLPFRVT